MVDLGSDFEPAPLVGQIAQPLAQAGMLLPDGTIAHTLAIWIDDTARPPDLSKAENSRPKWFRDG